MEEHHKVWVAFRSGDKQAFSDLYFTFYRPLYQYGLKLVQQEELVKDALQDFYLHLFENRANLADRVQNVRSYLLIAFRRRLMRAVQQRKTERDQQDEYSTSDLFVISTEEIVMEQEAKARDKAQVAQLLNSLPPRQREILYLKYYMNLSLPEIAEALAISYQVVANHLYRAHVKLKERVLS
jgi:RNA polymerase sigma factor (sigma-70 family)